MTAIKRKGPDPALQQQRNQQPAHPSGSGSTVPQGSSNPNNKGKGKPRRSKQGGKKEKQHTHLHIANTLIDIPAQIILQPSRAGLLTTTVMSFGHDGISY